MSSERVKRVEDLHLRFLTESTESTEDGLGALISPAGPSTAFGVVDGYDG
jgi:hypothetical protein